MTDFKKIQSYYSRFDEWSRLENPEGKLEFDITLKVIRQFLSPSSTILDLGGGPGRYTAMLSAEGHKMHLADISPDLISIAREKIKQYGNPQNVIRIDVCNALDLSAYDDGMFDAVLLLGPLYHLTSETEVTTCLSEVSRVLRKGGKVFAAYLPWIAGLTGVLERAFYAPGHVSPDALLETCSDGVFHNKSVDGFQEGAYIRTSKMTDHFSDAGFSKLLLRSIRGIGHKQEKNILALQDADPEYFSIMMQIIHQTATESAVIDTCGHALYIGGKI